MEPSFARKRVLIVLGALTLVVAMLAAAYAAPALADPPPPDPGVPAASIRSRDIGGRELALQAIDAGLVTDQAQSSAAPAATGIYGHVNSNGVAAAGVSLELRQYNSSTETVVATTQTDSSGNYAFTNAPTLPAGYRFFVLYGPNGTDPSRVYVWLGPDVTSFTAGGSVPGGNFDIGDVKMQAPAHNATLPLPITFSWTMRNVPADEYWLHLGQQSNDELFWNSDSVGHGSSTTLTTLPPGFSYSQQYIWYPVVYTPGGGLGLPYLLRYITFAQTTPGVKRSYLPALMLQPTLTPSPTPTATLTVPPNLCDDYEPNDYVLAAWGPLASNQEIQAKFCKNDIEDNYYVEAPSIAQPLVVTVRLPGKLVSHTDLWIYHSSNIQTPLSGCGRGPIASGNEVITCPITQTGRYIIRMYTHDSRVYYDDTQFYTLKATFATDQASTQTPTPTTTLTPTTAPTATPTATQISSGPRPGFWEDTVNPGQPDFTVTSDRKYVKAFSIYISISGCGNYKISRTSDMLITNNSFSATGSFSINGTFNSETSSSGTWKLTNFTITNCGTINAGPISFAAQWQRAAAQGNDPEAKTYCLQVDPIRPVEGALRP